MGFKQLWELTWFRIKAAWSNYQLQKPSSPANICLVSMVTRASSTIPSPQSDVLGQTAWAPTKATLLRAGAYNRQPSGSDIAEQGTGRYPLAAVAGGHLEPVRRCYTELYTWCARVCFLEVVLLFLFQVPFAIKAMEPQKDMQQITCPRSWIPFLASQEKKKKRERNFNLCQ